MIGNMHACMQCLFIFQWLLACRYGCSVISIFSGLYNFKLPNFSHIPNCIIKPGQGNEKGYYSFIVSLFITIAVLEIERLAITFSLS